MKKTICQIHQNIGASVPKTEVPRWWIRGNPTCSMPWGWIRTSIWTVHSGFTTSKHFAVSVLRCWPPLPYLGKPCTFSTQPSQCHEPNQPQATHQQLITATCCGPGAWKQVWFPFLRCSKPQKRAVTPSWPEGDLPRSVEGVSFVVFHYEATGFPWFPMISDLTKKWVFLAMLTTLKSPWMRYLKVWTNDDLLDSQIIMLTGPRFCTIVGMVMINKNNTYNFI